MRLLFLSNLYPPHSNGGYEQWCQEVAEGLRGRGHEVTVLTTTVADAQDEPAWVWRKLRLEMEFASFVHGVRFFTNRQVDEAVNLDCLRQVVAETQPDRIVVWGMWNLHRSLAALAEELLPGRVVYYLADYWPTLPSQHAFYWKAPAQNWVTRLPKTLLRPVAEQVLARQGRPALRMERVLFPSRFLLEEMQRLGVHMGEAQVVEGAIDVQPYLQSLEKKGNDGVLKLLFAGRLSPEKGIETAIEAVRILSDADPKTQVHLAIAGNGERTYVTGLRELVRQAGLDECISFSGPVQKQAMPSLYQQSDVFLFTSTWNEPFGRVIVEAQAAGCVVVGTATGGAQEILRDGENGLVFPPGDAAALARCILILEQNPSLAARLAASGRENAIRRYDLPRMVSEIETYLENRQEAA